jgi:hypothetical protein
VRLRLALVGIALLIVGAAGYAVWWNTQPHTADEAISAWRESVNRDCPITPATQKDIDAATEFADRLSERNVWPMVVNEQPGFVNVRWIRDDGAVTVYLYYVQLDCGYSERDLEAFTEPHSATMNGIFGESDMWQGIYSCLPDDSGIGYFERHRGRQVMYSHIGIEQVSGVRVAIIRTDSLDEFTLFQTVAGFQTLHECVREFYP